MLSRAISGGGGGGGGVRAFRHALSLVNLPLKDFDIGDVGMQAVESGQGRGAR